MNDETIRFFNLLLHSMLLSALGWLLVRYCIRDARWRAHASLVAVTLALAGPMIAPAFPTAWGSGEPEILSRFREASPAVWQVRIYSPVTNTKQASMATLEAEPAPDWTADRWVSLLRGIWWIGFLSMSLYHAWQSWNTRRWRLRLRRPSEDEWRRLSIGIEKPLGLRVFDHAGSPCVVGLLRPLIAVPASIFRTADAQQWRWILRHECEHIRAGDVMTAWLLGWARAFAWWNPFLHGLVECWARSREEVCDAAALDSSAESDAYVEFLIDAASNKYQCMSGAVSMVQSRPARRLRERLTALLEERPVCQRLGWSYLLRASVCLALGYALIASVGMKSDAQEKPAASALNGAKLKDEMITRTYLVPLGSVEPRITSKKLLEDRGAVFPEGASASYIPATSQLVVKNTKANLEMIEVLIANLIANAEVQLVISARFIEADQYLGPEGEILLAEAASRLVQQVSQKNGTKILSSPSVTTRIGQSATVEVGKFDPAKGSSKFTGIRLELDSKYQSKDRVELTARPIVGVDPKQPLVFDQNNKSEIDWARVEMFSAEMTKILDFGYTMICHIPKTQRPITVLVTANKILVAARPARGTGDNEAQPQIDIAVKIVDMVGKAGLNDDVQAGVQGWMPPALFEGAKGLAADVNPPAGVCSVEGIFTDPQFQVVIRALNQRKNTKLRSLPSVTVRGGEMATFSVPADLGGDIIKLEPVVGADGYVIDLNFTKESPGKDRPKGMVSVSLFDGNTLVLRENSDSKTASSTRLIFVTSKIVEPVKKKSKKSVK